eukprot:CAMPEP_0114675838 /NCGR_PEP_ID=MMETSP0191-20121206/48454_1 /TAXON_ID=126664 /ORGANISM="Sorites sp." /LENGTH=78 /DNA_ID=CAMNT_0001945873 /DNA_START=388 /DNA_END=621 /DNA_ORIENTATION=-
MAKSDWSWSKLSNFAEAAFAEGSHRLLPVTCRLQVAQAEPAVVCRLQVAAAEQAVVCRLQVAPAEPAVVCLLQVQSNW